MPFPKTWGLTIDCEVICGAGHHLTTLIETVLPHEERSPAPPLKATVLDSLYPSRSLIVSGLGD